MQEAITGENTKQNRHKKRDVSAKASWTARYPFGTSNFIIQNKGKLKKTLICVCFVVVACVTERESIS